MDAESVASGFAAAVQRIYEGLFLRDVLGYALPGAVFLLGTFLTVSGVPLWTYADTWWKVALLIAVAYVCGVFLRLLGTLLRVLVISSDHIGVLGDPWQLNGNGDARKWINWTWRTAHQGRIVAMYKTQLRGDTDRARLSSFIRRESLFLHIGGNLGFALLLLLVLFVIFRTPLPQFVSLPAWFLPQGGWSDLPVVGCILPWQIITALAVGCIPLLVGHYAHAQAIRLLLEAEGVEAS